MNFMYSKTTENLGSETEKIDSTQRKRKYARDKLCQKIRRQVGTAIADYNMIEQEIKTPIVCGGFTILPNGELCYFKADDEQTKHHMIQIWQTPYLEGDIMPSEHQDSMLYKIGNKDIRVSGITKERGQGILRKIGIIDDGKGRANFEKDAKGEMQTIRTVVAKAEGFTLPVNFKVSFQRPKGISQQTEEENGARAGVNYGKVKFGSLDWQTHIMNNSTTDEFESRWWAAQRVSSMDWNPTGSDKNKQKRSESKINLFCSKVTIPEKNITAGLYRHYGASFAYPQSVTHGTLTTTFYCDGTMHIKNFFDAWQKLIYNDQTGNFNFYDEYISEFDIFTRTTMAQGAKLNTDEEDTSLFGKVQKASTSLSNNIQAATNKLNEVTGVDGPRSGTQYGTEKLPQIVFRENYGVKIFECWPSIVGGIELSHESSGIATFDVTWQYSKWNPFKMGNVGRQRINLAIGEFRNEKSGFPFISDLPPELSGPLTGAIGQGINTGPLSKASNIVG